VVLIEPEGTSEELLVDSRRPMLILLTNQLTEAGVITRDLWCFCHQPVRGEQIFQEETVRDIAGYRIIPHHLALAILLLMESVLIVMFHSHEYRHQPLH
jgi:hypothetical protein